MLPDVPEESRLAARVILLDDEDRVLLLHAEHAMDGQRFWVAPGGGLQAGEDFRAAAQREAYEETGLELCLGPCVWTRRHAFVWNGKRYDQYERFFVARTSVSRIEPRQADDYVIGYRWWSLGELQTSHDIFAPRRLVHLLPAILRGEYPGRPLDCGI